MFKSSILVAIISFFCGYFISNWFKNDDTENNLSRTENQKKTQDFNIANEEESSLFSNLGHLNSSEIIKISKQNQEKITEILNTLPESKIDHYLNQAFLGESLEGIVDKRKFSARLVEELNQTKDESNSLSGKIYISDSSEFTGQNKPLNDVYKQQYIYAHFDTFGKTPPNAQVFVKWINQDTDETILFTPKRILENSHQNWVSALPEGGWKPGTYNVKFYQMTDSLTPIAQSSYTIRSILQ